MALLLHPARWAVVRRHDLGPQTLGCQALVRLGAELSACVQREALVLAAGRPAVAPVAARAPVPAAERQELAERVAERRRDRVLRTVCYRAVVRPVPPTLAGASLALQSLVPVKAPFALDQTAALPAARVAPTRDRGRSAHVVVGRPPLHPRCGPQSPHLPLAQPSPPPDCPAYRVLAAELAASALLIPPLQRACPDLRQARVLSRRTKPAPKEADSEQQSVARQFAAVGRESALRLRERSTASVQWPRERSPGPPSMRLRTLA